MGESLRRHPPFVPWIAVAALGVAAARARKAQQQAEATAQREHEERERKDAALRRTENARRHEQELIKRLERSRRAERAFTRDLRDQLQRLHEARRMLSSPADARELILRAALDLLGAEKGLLLESADADADGDLDLALSVGFSTDPEHSAVAQRFARLVLERDEMIREDHPFAERPGHELTAADREISNLVAVPLYIRDRFHGAVVACNRQGGFEEVDDELLLALGDHAGAELHAGHVRRDLHDSHRASVRMLLEAQAARDLVLHHEAAEAAVFADDLARILRLDDHQRDVLVLATLLRDIGYLALPDQLLLQQTALDSDERAVVEMHPRIGFRFLRQLPVLGDVAYTVLHHHERIDGGGYPFGLSADEIPLTARALSVVDAYVAMTHDRPHRSARDSEEACAELVAHAGTQFDPEVTQLFIEAVRLRGPSLPADIVEAFAEAVPLGAAEGMLGALTDPGVDGLTLLGTHRAFRERVAQALTLQPHGELVVLALLQLEDLARLNEEAGLLAGDRLIQAAARDAEQVAARVGGRAFRVSGRRLAIVTTCPSRKAREVVDHVNLEFRGGPSIRVAVAFGNAADRPDELIERARAALRATGGMTEAEA